MRLPNLYSGFRSRVHSGVPVLPYQALAARFTDVSSSPLFRFAALTALVTGVDLYIVAWLGFL